MTTNFSALARRIATALAGSAVATGVLAGAVALGAPANAAPQGMNCTTAQVSAPSPDYASVLTRAGQLDLLTGVTRQAVSATSCIGR